MAHTITFDPAAYFGSSFIEPIRGHTTYPEQWVSVVAQQHGRLHHLNVAARAITRPTPAQVDVLKVAADCFVLWCSHSRTHESLRARMAHVIGGRVETLVDDANAIAEQIYGYDDSDWAVVVVSRLLTWLQGTWLLGARPTAEEQALIDPVLDGKRHALSVQVDMPRIDGLKMLYGAHAAHAKLEPDLSHLVAGIGIDRVIVGSQIVYGGDGLDNGCIPLAFFIGQPNYDNFPGLGRGFTTGQRIQIVLRRTALTRGDHQRIGLIPAVREVRLSVYCE